MKWERWATMGAFALTFSAAFAWGDYNESHDLGIGVFLVFQTLIWLPCWGLTLYASILERRREAETNRLLLELCHWQQERLQEIVDHPTTSRNPDGVDQAADEMKLIAEEGLRG